MANKMGEQTPKTYYKVGQFLVHPDNVATLTIKYSEEGRDMAKKKGKGKGKGC